MRTSLQAIANKAAKEKRHRFTNLATLLTEENLADTWRMMNRSAAPGVDRRNAREYEGNLMENIRDLVARLRGNRYRAKLIRRVHIPKGNGKTRPLGLPVTEDKLLQAAVSRILGSIYEADFLPVSFGYRPGRGAQQAVGQLDRELQFGKYAYIVEADIAGFFDNIDHRWLSRMIAHRVADSALMRLVAKWLRAGVLETDGQVTHPLTGTPQGGVISPILSNIYLHYALDLWFEKVVKRHCRGEAYLCRYADDFVCAFEHSDDAKRFHRALSGRLGKFGLRLAPDKTRIIPFVRGNGGSAFEFLGFEFRWGVSRGGRPWLKRRTSRKKFRASLHRLSEFCREHRHLRLREFFELLNARLRGHYNYFGVIGNYRSLAEFHDRMEAVVFKWLNRRSQRKSFRWATYKQVLRQHNLVQPRITEKRDMQLTLL